MYYEMRITMSKVNDPLACRIFLADRMWVYSCEGDAGRQAHYATRYVNGAGRLDDVTTTLNSFAADLVCHGYTVDRREIGMTIYDERGEPNRS